MLKGSDINKSSSVLENEDINETSFFKNGNDRLNEVLGKVE